MKITKTRLRQIIKEEIKLMLEFERYVYRRKDGTWWITDDEGNDEPDDSDESLAKAYPDLVPGEQGETIFGTGDLGRYRDDRDDWADPGGSYGGAAYGDSYGGADSRRRRRRRRRR